MPRGPASIAWEIAGRVDETYVKVAGQWRYVCPAIDQLGQVIDVFVSSRRDATAAHRFFERAIGSTKVRPAEVMTDHAPVYPMVLEEMLPAAWHRTDRHANNRAVANHGQLKARRRPMRGSAGPQRQGRNRRACLRAESATSPLRTRGRGAGDPAFGGRGRRADHGHLIKAEVASSACPGSDATQHCHVSCSTRPNEVQVLGEGPTHATPGAGPAGATNCDTSTVGGWTV
jgi:hypothetical protein